MTHRQIRHEQFFPVKPDDIVSDILAKAENFLRSSAEERPDWEYVIQFKNDGILVTGTTIE